MTPTAKTQLVLTLAREVGADLAGVAPVAPVRRAAYYRQWLAAGYGGTMSYLARNVQSRAEPARLLPGARSIICVAVNYKRRDGYLGAGATVPCRRADDEPTGTVAQYARGSDYHVILRALLEALVERLRGRLDEPFEARVFVDTGPVLEKELAVSAGLGWFGKNTCLINGELGSYLLLGEVATTLELEVGHPGTPQCGSCTRCIDSCPSSAFIGPFRIEATRCIAYLTIEHRGPISESLRAAIADRVFGCDVCQQVCPYNSRAPLGTHPGITADVLPERVKIRPLLGLSDSGYAALLGSSPATRAAPGMWRRNAGIVSANHLRCASGRAGGEA
jgi:epoxyqueuosine reductase